MTSRAYKYLPEHLPYMKEQIWEARDDLSVYSRLSEHEYGHYRQALPEHPKVIMDIGCGLGRAAVYLNWAYKDPDIEYVLADRTGWFPNTGVWDGDEYYNDLALTESFSRLNGVQRLRLFDTEEGDWAALPKTDLIISTCAIGMHVPIERYLEKLLAASSAEATMIFGVRHESYSADSFPGRFSQVLMLPAEYAEGMPRLNGWLVIKR